jgi:arylsulfatase A-like enzyme
MVSQLDILESLASLTNVKVESTDGQNLLNTFLGKTERGRDNFVLEATSRTAYREADWVLIPPYQGPSIEEKVNIELGNSDGYMLFDLAKDPTQQQNLATLEPEKLQLMIKNFEAIRGTDYNDIQLLELK